MSRAAIESILVAGDGVVGLSAALALSRALPAAKVTILRLAADPAAMADQFPATLPAVGRFHAAIGFDEIDLVRRGIAMHHLGTHFTGDGSDWVHSFGEVGRGEGAVPFHLIWLAASADPGGLAFDRYAPASVIGRAGKFVHPSGDPGSPLADYLYGLRLHPAKYRDALLAATRHLPRVDGQIDAIERRGDGGIGALVVADGERVAADLYLDCTGAAATLSNLIGPAMESWSQWLPPTQVAADWQPADELAPLDQVESIPGGWHLTATVPGEMLRASFTNLPVLGTVQIHPGRRDPFAANVVAIGDSATALDPLHGCNLSLAHSAILRLIDLLPGRDCHPLEVAEYNRLSALEANRARDFHILFQSQLPRAAPPPDSLDRTLTQWRSRGRLPFFEEEIFTPSDWTQALIGLGVMPVEVAPLALAINPAAAAQAMASFASELDQIVVRLPDYPGYLARMGRAP